MIIPMEPILGTEAVRLRGVRDVNLTEVAEEAWMGGDGPATGPEPS